MAWREFTQGSVLIATELAVWPEYRKADIADRYWISDLPESYTRTWETINPAAHQVYEQTMREYYLKKSLDI